MQRIRLAGGIILLILAAIIFLTLDADSSVPIAIGLALVGIALIATSRKRAG